MKRVKPFVLIILVPCLMYNNCVYSVIRVVCFAYPYVYNRHNVIFLYISVYLEGIRLKKKNVYVLSRGGYVGDSNPTRIAVI